jgi:hypothetical protein
LVESDDILARAIKRLLEHEGHSVNVVRAAPDATGQVA